AATSLTAASRPLTLPSATLLRAHHVDRRGESDQRRHRCENLSYCHCVLLAKMTDFIARPGCECQLREDVRRILKSDESLIGDSKSGNLKLDWQPRAGRLSNLRFRISNFQCRTRPISKFFS